MQNSKNHIPTYSIKLLNWYRDNKRDLPWRLTEDAYKIWLSEIILQQTRVAQGTAYYLKFLKHYPTVQNLANASEEEVLKDWQGLGYYSRARNLHAAAKQIINEFNGQFPNNYKSIKSLKGVGDYTAAAIASFAFSLPYAVVDGNVYRVLSRIFGIETPIDSSVGKKEFALLAQDLLDEENAGEHNQAMMEFGAIHCTPKNPSCDSCVFQTDCIAFKLNKVNLLPVKEKKLKQKIRYLHYLIFENADKIAINKRDTKGIWQNMYDFPLVEAEKQLTKKQLLENDRFITFTNRNNFEINSFSESRKHILSHQILRTVFFHITVEKIDTLKEHGFEIINKEKLAQRPIPKLIENYLNEETNLLYLFKR